jgi:predicted RNase H-like HicB family nuclease
VSRRVASVEYPVVLEKDEDVGGFVVYCATLKGCVSQGETDEKTLENITDAIRPHLLALEYLKRQKRMRTVEVIP